MSIDRALALKAAWDQGQLNDAGQAELAALLRESEQVRRAIGGDCLVDRGLRLLASEPSADEVMRGVERRRQAEASASDFMQRVRPHTRLKSRRRKPLPLPLWIGAAAACLIAAILLWPAEQAATLRVLAASGCDVQAGDELPVGSSLHTGSDGSAELAWSDGSRIALAGDSALVIQQLSAESRLRLERGHLQAEVATQAPGRHFVVETPHAQVRVIGTRFTVSVDRRTRVAVDEGRVQVDDQHGEQRLLAAGEDCIIGSPWADALVDYRFDSGTALITDHGPHGLDLQADDPQALRWHADGLQIERACIIRSQRPASELIAACKRSGAITIVADITPPPIDPSTDPEDLPRRIVCLPIDYNRRNFSLGQGLYATRFAAYDLRLQTSTGMPDGRPSVATTEAVAQPQRSLLIVTRDTDGNTRFHLNGQLVPVRQIQRGEEGSQTAGSTSVVLGGDLQSWQEGLHLVLAGEPEAGPNGKHRHFLGRYHRLAIFDRALTADEIAALSTSRTMF